MNLTEKTLEEKVIFDGRVIHVSLDKIELPNGRTSSREVVKHPGGVGIAALTENGEIILVNQFRYPYKSEILEIPAGKLNPGEDPLECGKRELREETGAAAAEYINLGKLLPSPGYTNEIIHLYLAKDLSYGKQQPDEDEFLDIVKMPLEKAVKMVMSGEIKDSKTQVALLKTWFFVNKT